MATAFDTLSTYEAITAAGVDDKAARAISKAIADSVTAYRANLATRDDLKLAIAELRAELKTEIATVRELIASTQNRTIIWNFGMMVTFAGLIVAGIKLL